MKNRILLAVVALVVLGAAVFLIRERTVEREVRQTLKQDNVAKKEEVRRLKKNIVRLEEALEKEREVGAPPPPERMEEVFGQETATPEETTEPPVQPQPPVPEEPLIPTKVTPEEKAAIIQTKPKLLGCASLESRINSFFVYLDKKGYPFEAGSFAYFQDISIKLSNRLPIPGETLSSEDVLNNSYHFYRALSKKDIRIIKEVLYKEKDAMEQAMYYLYQHFSRCGDQEKFLPPLDILYEYSHFFLNSMGGRSYLFRLGGRLRLMLYYYSTMIVHEAELKEVNRYGLDIRPYLNKLEDDLRNQRGLYNLDMYLEKVRKVKAAYRPLKPPA